MKTWVVLGTLSIALVAAGALACGSRSASAPAAANDPAPSDAAKPDAKPPAPAATAAVQPAADAYDPGTAAGAVRGTPAPTNTASIEAVANYYTDIPGVDLKTLDARAQQRFLQRVNSELCTCGCKRDTLAHCRVNDPSCRVIKGLVQGVYDEVRAGR